MTPLAIQLKRHQIIGFNADDLAQGQLAVRLHNP